MILHYRMATPSVTKRRVSQSLRERKRFPRFANKIKPQPVRAGEENVIEKGVQVGEGVGMLENIPFRPPPPPPTFKPPPSSRHFLFSFLQPTPQKIELFVIADKLIMQPIIYLFTLRIFNRRLGNQGLASYLMNFAFCEWLLGAHRRTKPRYNEMKEII